MCWWSWWVYPFHLSAWRFYQSEKRQDQAKATTGSRNRKARISFMRAFITVFIENSGRLETDAQIAAHESPSTTKLYDRTNDKIALEEIERLRL